MSSPLRKFGSQAVYYGALRFGPRSDQFVSVGGPRTKNQILEDLANAFCAGNYDEDCIGYLLRRPASDSNTSAKHSDVETVVALRAPNKIRCLRCATVLDPDVNSSIALPGHPTMDSGILVKKTTEAVAALQTQGLEPEGVGVIPMCPYCGQLHIYVQSVGLQPLSEDLLNLMPRDIQAELRRIRQSFIRRPPIFMERKH